MKPFQLNDTFQVGPHTAKVVSIMSYCGGLLSGVQVLHVMLNNDPALTYRTIRWPGGEMYRMVRLTKDQV